MASPTLADLLQASPFELPDIPTLTRGSSWDTAFTHKSLPDSNLVLAALGNDVFRACVTEWLLDADPLLTQSELEVGYRRYDSENASNAHLQRNMLGAHCRRVAVKDWTKSFSQHSLIFMASQLN